MIMRREEIEFKTGELAGLFGSEGRDFRAGFGIRECKGEDVGWALFREAESVDWETQRATIERFR